MQTVKTPPLLKSARGLLSRGPLFGPLFGALFVVLAGAFSFATAESPGAAAGVAAGVSQALDEPQFRKAVEAYAAGRLDESKRAFEKLAERFPNDPGILNNLAVIAARHGNVEQAAELLKRAIATDAAINTGYRNLTAVYAHWASLSYREALSLESEDPEPLELSLIGPSPTDETGRVASAKPEAAEQIVQAKELDEPLVRDPEEPASSGQNRDVVSAVRRWAQAWSRRDLNAYFASYVGGYTPPGGTHRGWRSLRTERLTAPRRIEVGVSDVQVRKTGEDDARVTFRQRYRSNLLSSSVIKRLLMKRINGEWKITSERVL